MGIAKRTRKFAQVKRVIGQKDARITQKKAELEAKKNQQQALPDKEEKLRRIPQMSSSLFFQYNTALVPPYSVLLDTNFINHSVQRKLELLPTMMDCLYATCNPVITDCVMAELEKLGPRYRIALQVARDERWQRLSCDHKGTYADDCLVSHIMQHKVYIWRQTTEILSGEFAKYQECPS